MSKRFIIISLLSLFITAASPYFFKGYFAEKPEKTLQSVNFGGPLPFVSQLVQVPDDTKVYPLEVEFQSPFDTETEFNAITFVLSFVLYLAILFSLYTILIRFFNKNDRYEK